MGLLRLESLFGTAVNAVRSDELAGLVTGRVREDSDLEFKSSLYGNGDAERRDLAGDVAALANSGGGVLIIGIDEQDGAAIAFAPVPLSEAEELRMRQIVASLVAPHPQFTLHRIQVDADSGCYLLEVPNSSQAPHAVTVNNGLRYPRRDGASIRWLPETEVADSYRSRFLTAQGQIERVGKVLEEGKNALPASDETAWLGVATVPNTPGLMAVTRESVQKLAGFPRSVPFPSFGDATVVRAAGVGYAGHRRVSINLGQTPQGQPYSGVVHLHSDGSAFVGVRIGREAQRGDVRLGVLLINDEWLVQECIGAVALSVAHAVRNCGTQGDAVIEASLWSNMPMTLHHGRAGFDDTWNDFRITETPIAEHTIALDAAYRSPTELLVATRQPLTDLFQGFGVADPPQLTADGGIRVGYFRDDNRRRVLQEAERWNLQVE